MNSTNSVNLIGRLTQEPEARYSAGQNSNAACSFTLAVNRRFKNSEGTYDADFIRCVAFRQQAEFMDKYLHKGNLVAVCGEIRTGSYTNKEGAKVYTTEVYADDVKPLESKASSNNEAAVPKKTDNSFMNVPDGIDEELPFN